MPNLGAIIQTEAWILRSLVFIFSRAAKRGHRPREPQMIQLMIAAEVPVPDPSPPRRSQTASTVSFWSVMNG